MEGLTAPIGVSNTEIDVAETLLGLSNMTNLLQPHGRHEVLQMLDGTLHADTTRGKHNIDSDAERLHSPILIADHEDRQKKRKHEDEAFSELKQRPSGLLKTQRCTEVIQHDDRHRQGHLILKIKLGNRSLGTKASIIRSPIQDQFSGAGSQNLMHAPSYGEKQGGSQKADSTISVPRGETSDNKPIVPVADSVTKQSLTTYARFSFSILQLLTAVRMALIVQSAYDDVDVDEITGEISRRDVIYTGQVKTNSLSSLTIHEIVQRVKRRPGDPKILETQEPLQDLVKGVLNIFSSQTALPGVNSWKGLATYDTSTKSWYWIGPVPSKLKSKDWGISPEILPELIDSFAEWMRQRQETTELIRSLPPPPESLIQIYDMEERYRLQNCLKIHNTISPSSEEVKAHFHTEEALRYRIPDRVFPYTARDGTKCTVAPLRRCSDNSSIKARDHYVLKRTRPDQFGVRSFVRDAAARLPGRIGTTADICTLVRDSQYIVEDISEDQIGPIVRRSLDRLRYETDPCVRYDREKHFWVYLHGDRIDVDFKDHGPCPRNKSQTSEDEHAESQAVQWEQAK